MKMTKQINLNMNWEANRMEYPIQINSDKQPKVHLCSQKMANQSNLNMNREAN